MTFGWTQQWKMVSSFFQCWFSIMWVTWLCRFRGDTRWLSYWARKELPLLQEWCGVPTLLQWKQEAQVNIVCRLRLCVPIFTASRWYCHFDDDVYVNIPELLSSLVAYNPLQQRVYIGRWPLAVKQLVVPERVFPEAFPLPVSNNSTFCFKQERFLLL